MSQTLFPISHFSVANILLLYSQTIYSVRLPKCVMFGRTCFLKLVFNYKTIQELRNSTNNW